jgi:hypothetical protein
MVDGGLPVGARKRLTLIVGDRDQRVLRPARVDPWQVLEVEPAVKRRHGARRALLEEREVDEVDMEMQDVELVLPSAHVVQLREMGREVGLERRRVEPDRLVTHRHERGLGPRLGGREQRHLVAELRQGIRQMRHDPFRAAVEAWRHRLVQRCDLRDPHQPPFRVFLETVGCGSRAIPRS